jgi:hypothetical protein
MVAIDNKFEGAYVVRRGGFWYLFASTANCCAGPATGYSVQVGRSRDLRGPYVDRQGVRLTASRAGGTPVLVQNGNRWIGAGHNAVVTDLTGQDWIAYHAINRADPYLDGTDGINERPMLLDRLDWVGGWPAVRAGAGPSASRQRAPVVRGRQVTRFTGGIGPAWARLRGWTTAADPQAGRYARSADASALLTRSRSRGPVRVEADLRSPGHAYGLVAGSRPGGSGVSVVLDPRAGSLRLREVRSGRVVGAARAALPAGFRPGEWHNLALELRGRTALAHLTHARLGDPVAAVTLRLRSRDAASGRAGALTGGAGVGLDNLSVLPASVPVTRLVPDPPPGRLDTARSDEFSGPVLRPGWTWVRPDPAAAVQGGMLRWPTQAADLVGTVNDAAVLLRDPGPGSWTAQTKVTIDLGTDTIRNFQQAGLVAYVGDDQFARLSHVAIWNTRQTEFGHELPFAGRLAFGGTIVGPPAATTWLRLTHRLDSRNREHELRAWTSRDGRTWVKGGVWTLPAAGTLRVGLVSHGGAGATAQFDYLRIFRG